MTWKIAIRTALLTALAWLSGPSCASKTEGGTDSNTHWVVCQTVLDCPHDATYDCVGNRCVVAVQDSGSPTMGGTCPASAVSLTPCDGRIAQCWTPCTGQYHGQFVCSGGTWLAGHGLFPCNQDSAVSPPDGRSPGGDAGVRADGSPRSADAAAIDSGGVSSVCQRNSDCTLVDKTCCGKCGVEPTLADKAAIRVDSVSAWYSALCAGGGACPPCVPPEGTLQGVCNTGRCETVNLAQDKECLKDTDCAIRPVDCCACGALTKRSDVIALNSSAPYPQCGTKCALCPGGVQLPPQVATHCYLSGGYCVLD